VIVRQDVAHVLFRSWRSALRDLVKVVLQVHWEVVYCMSSSRVRCSALDGSVRAYVEKVSISSWSAPIPKTSRSERRRTNVRRKETAKKKQSAIRTCAVGGSCDP
jgi:hypothetical protein